MKPIAIFDLDSTLSDDAERKWLLPEDSRLDCDPDTRDSLFDAYHDSCDDDAPVPYVLAMLEGVMQTHEVIIITSRSERFREKTENWLCAYIRCWEAKDENLLMRPDGNTDDSPKLKFNLYQSISKDFPLCSDSFAVDDRDDVLEMWDDLGISTIKINHLS